MADEESTKGPKDMALLVFGGLAVLIVFWFLSGGPSRTDLKGIFLSPPAPVGNGNAYGTKIDIKTNTQTNQ
jgi:hypothetical protein